MKKILLATSVVYILLVFCPNNSYSQESIISTPASLMLYCNFDNVIKYYSFKNNNTNIRLKSDSTLRISKIDSISYIVHPTIKKDYIIYVECENKTIDSFLVSSTRIPEISLFFNGVTFDERNILKFDFIVARSKILDLLKVPYHVINFDVYGYDNNNNNIFIEHNIGASVNDLIHSKITKMKKGYKIIIRNICLKVGDEDMLIPSDEKLIFTLR